MRAKWDGQFDGIHDEVIIKQYGVDIEFDDDRKIITIEGAKYSYAFFHELGIRGMPVGQIFRIVNRNEDGQITIERIGKQEEVELEE